MRKLLLAAVAVMGLSGSAAAVDPGVYYCVTERMVGIQPEREVKEGENPYHVPRFYGQIKPAKEKFIVKIQRIDETTRNHWCKGEPPLPEMVLYCSDLMVWEAILPEEKRSLWSMVRPLVSDTGLIFTNNGMTTLMISSNLEYVLSRMDLSDTTAATENYLEEGHCETFEE